MRVTTLLRKLVGVSRLYVKDVLWTIDGDLVVEARPGAWRPLSWLAHHYLEIGEREEALWRYARVLEMAGGESDALLGISGDLGNAGCLEDLLRLVLPRFSVEQHAEAVGFNLLEACVQTGNIDAGRKLLRAMRGAERPDLRQSLGEYESRLLEAADSRNPMTVPAELNIELVSIGWPVWYMDLENPEWLLPNTEAGLRVAILPFSAPDAAEGGEARAGREDAAGTACRGVALYLADRLMFEAGSRATMFVPLLERKGIVLTAEDWGPEHLDRLKGRAKRASTSCSQAPRGCAMAGACRCP